MKKLLVLLLCVPLIGISQSQEIDKVSVYLDCYCDNDFIKRNIPYVDFFIDPNYANLHIIVKSERSGNGGSQVTFRFIGKDVFQGVNNTIQLNLLPNVTDDKRKKLYLETLEKGLFSYVIKTKEEKHLQIKYVGDSLRMDSVSLKDPWNYWVSRISSNASVSGSEGLLRQYYYSSISINRVTEESKFLSSFSYSNDLTTYSYDDLNLKTKSESMSMYLTYVKSIGDYFSIGGKSRYTKNTYYNLDASYRISPCIEYNFFPYSESSEHRFSIFYGIAATYNDYTDTTIYLKTKEIFPSHGIDIEYSNSQTWGSVYVGLSGDHIIDSDDMNKYNIGLFSSVRWNITKGFSFNYSARIGFDRKQIHLRSNGASYEELLLGLQDIKSDYSFSTSAGISYTFGSMKNNFVNPRFE
jgi:hypothetical protein